jgi:hypothetical protein
MKKVTLNRKQLHDLVWATPLTKISEKFQITIPEIKQACTTLKVPLPTAGYWTRLHMGQNVFATELSTEKTETTEIELEERIEGNKTLKGISEELMTLINDIESKHASDLIVPDRLTKPDPLIEDSRKSFQTSDRSYHGSLHPDRETLDIHVSKDNVTRALLFVDTLLKLLRKRGQKIEISDRNSYVTIKNTRVKFYLREKTNRVKSSERWGGSTYTPSGILYLRMEIGYFNKLEWSDGRDPLENQLSKIIAKLELKVIEAEEQERLWKIEAEKREIQRRKEEAIENRKRKQESDFKNILQESRTWKEIETAKQYINYVEKSLKKDKKLYDKAARKILWMRRRLEQFDPAKDSNILDSDED